MSTVRLLLLPLPISLLMIHVFVSANEYVRTTVAVVQGLQNWDRCSLTGELLQLRRSRGSEVGTVAVSQKAGAPQAVIPPCQGTVFELLPPKCQGTVLERTRRTAESNCLDCCTAASNSAWRFSLRLGGTVRKHAVAIEARFSLAS